MSRVPRAIRLLTAAVAFACALAAPACADPQEETAMATDRAWRFFTDTVMGGVSTGRAVVMEEDGERFLRMTGKVSTANRGGFIQMRTDLAAPPPEDATGVRLVVRGNGESYFVHLRTTGTVLPWQFYQAPFATTGAWTEVRLPFTAFGASGGAPGGGPRAATLTSLAVAGYGRDHAAQIDVREAGFY